MALAKVLYFIDRGHARPSGHRAPYHRYLVCTEYARARQEAGDTGARAYIWERVAWGSDSGWLLVRWKGLDIDYGYVVHSPELPDGTRAGFVHPHKADEMPWVVLGQAVWWSEKSIPRWLEQRGVKLPGDAFSRGRIRGEVMENRRRVRYVFPDDTVLVLGDWLEERGHAAAAADIRRQMGGEESAPPGLFEAAPEGG